MSARTAARLLWLCTTLFLLRVLAQLVQYLVPLAWLPDFTAWQGSTLAYPLLLSSQLLILLTLGYYARRCAAGRIDPQQRTGRLLIGSGALYFAAMLLRLLLGLTVLSGHAWFDKPLPTFFHLVLAGYILTLGCYHLFPSHETAEPCMPR